MMQLPSIEEFADKRGIHCGRSSKKLCFGSRQSSEQRKQGANSFSSKTAYAPSAERLETL
jgi:hypothetical protein